MAILKRNRGLSAHAQFNKSVIPNTELTKAFYKNYSDTAVEKRIELDCLAHALTVRVGATITKNPPIFLDSSENEIEEVREAWVKGDYDSLLREVIIASRGYGFCVTESLSQTFAGKMFLVHNPANGIQKILLDDRWNVKNYEIKPTLEENGKISTPPQIQSWELKADKALHYEVGRSRYNQQGQSILKPIWGLIVNANDLLEAMAASDMRYGYGWVYAIIDPKLYDGKEKDLATALASMNAKRNLVLYGNDNFKPELGMLTPSGTVDFVNDLLAILAFISAGTGFPLRWFIGDPKGAQSAAKEDRMAVYETLKSIFGEYKDWIRLFIEKFFEGGEAISEQIAEIEWDDQGVLEEIKNQMAMNPLQMMGQAEKEPEEGEKEQPDFREDEDDENEEE